MIETEIIPSEIEVSTPNTSGFEETLISGTPREQFQAFFGLIEAKYDPYSSEETLTSLLDQARAGITESRNEFIFRQAWIVRTSILRNFRDFDILNSPLVMDLVDEGFEAMTRSLKTYDKKEGAFSTYAFKVLGQRLRHYLLEERGLPGRLKGSIDDYITVSKTHDQLEETLGRKPSTEAVGAMLPQYLPERVEEFLLYKSPPVSLFGVVERSESPEGDKTIEDTLEDQTAEGEYLEAEKETYGDVLINMLDTSGLEPEDLAVAKFALGFEDGIRRPSKEVAEILGIEAAKVKKIVSRAQMLIRNQMFQSGQLDHFRELAEEI